jgi:hypothetical protein
MPKPRKVWTISPAKIPKPVVPESIKADLTDKAMHLIESVLKPTHVLPPDPEVTFNYIADISGKWNRCYFYFNASYACPGPDALSPSFDRKFARMEYVGDGKFALSYFRHTGVWYELFAALSVEECLKSIQSDPWFIP